MLQRVLGIGWSLSFVLLVASGCGDGEDGGVTGSGLDPDRTWASLTPGERAELCDFLSAKLGGYGHKADCGDSDDASWAAPDRQTCVDSIPVDCRSPVSALEECIDAVAGDVCHGETIQMTHPACGRCGG